MMNEPDPTISERLPTNRHDNKLILNCQACHYRCLVDVTPNAITDWICPMCSVVNRVSSEIHDRQDWISELARKAGLRK